MNRLDVLLADYETKRQKAKTYQEFKQLNQHLVKAIDDLPGDKTQTESMVRALFAGMC